MLETDPATAGGRLPKLIFFRSIREGIPGFLRGQMDELVRCLSQFFEVIELPPDCDYDEVCDRYQPDLVLFESGADSSTGGARMRNTSAHPEIPKLGLLYADAVDAVRATFISNMAEWGVETFFTHSVAMGEYTPEIADRLYVWPNFIDPTIFRDYGQGKTVPILFTGSQIGFYPWRNAVSRVLSAQYPTMICPHVGWHARAGAHRMMFGEKYARLLSASTFVPTCGSVTRDLVRKHLEIPAAGACLVTERSAALESVGFRDLENCVFATPEDVVDKLDMLLEDEERLGRIIRAGHDLVHSRHTMAQRSQIREWFDLNRQLKAGETIIQDGPAGSLRIAASSARQASSHVISGGLDRVLLRKGWDAIEAGSPEVAETFFLRCLNFAFTPEALLGLTHCRLLKGDSEGAKGTIQRWLDVTFVHHKCKDPDPVAWATSIRVALCGGNLDEARAQARLFPHLRHQELDRIRAALGIETGEGTPRPSIAPPPNVDEHEWKRRLNLMLKACGQGGIETAIGAGHQPAPTVAAEARQGKAAAASRSPVRMLVRRAKAGLRGFKRNLTENDWTFQVDRIASCEPALRAVILAPSSLNLGQRALRRSLRRNPWLPQIVEVRGEGSAFRPGDLVYVTAQAVRTTSLDSLIDSAGLVFVDGANLPDGQRLTEALSGRADYALILHDTTGKAGYAIFRRLAPQLAWQEGLLGERSGADVVSHPAELQSL